MTLLSWEHTIGMKWQIGDALLIDNFAITHDRAPF